MDGHGDGDSMNALPKPDVLGAIVRVGSATDSDPGPIEASIGSLALTGGALAIVVTSFFLALKYAGKAGAR